MISVAESRRGIGALVFYNNERPHQALDYQHPKRGVCASEGLWTRGQRNVIWTRSLEGGLAIVLGPCGSNSCFSDEVFINRDSHPCLDVGRATFELNIHSRG